MLLPQGVGVAARNGDIPAVRAWLDGSGDIDAFTKESPGFTLLFAAASSGRADVVSFLLDRGADATVGIRDDKFPLITAAMTFIIYRPSSDGPEMPFSTLTSQKEADLLRIVELLIAHGADVNAKGRLGETCFTVALILLFMSCGRPHALPRIQFHKTILLDPIWDHRIGRAVWVPRGSHAGPGWGVCP